VKARVSRRLVALLALMLLAFGSIAARLTVLQVGDHGSLEALGLDQRVRTIDLPAARGQILDRRGGFLVECRLALTPQPADRHLERVLVAALGHPGEQVPLRDPRLRRGQPPEEGERRRPQQHCRRSSLRNKRGAH